MPNKTIIAILCVTILLTIALLKGMNGALLATGLSAIVGLGGYALGKKQPPP